MTTNQPVLLLHGALGSSNTFIGLKALLSETNEVYLLDFQGHGKSEMPLTDITTEYYATQVIDFLAKNNLEKTHIFGYSMGGYVGMYLAKHHPEKVMSLTTFATKWAWTSEVAEKEATMLNPEKIEEKVPKFASNLALLHGEMEWKILVNHIKDFLLHLGIAPTFSLSDFSNIETPIKLGVGDRDLTVSIEETIAVYRQLPNTPHPFEKVNIDVLKRVML